MNRMRLTCWMFLVVCSALAHASGEEIVCDRAAALESAPHEFDRRSGSDTLDYPRDPKVHYNHLTLTLRFEDLSSKSFTGRAVYSLRAIAPGVRSLKLDAVDFLDVSTKIGGSVAEFSYDGETITIAFPADLPTDADTSVQIDYRVVDPETGLIFVPPDPAYPDRSVGLHTQGQTEMNRYWFPAHDSPNVKFTSEMIVTVPRPLTAVSNGKLLERREEPGDRLWTFHWQQDVPHVAYLVSLAVADFDVQRDELHGVPIEYYVPKPWAADTRRTFARTPQMIALFEKLTGVKYPYAKYAQVVAPNYEGGGMENISATTLVETCLIDERATLDDDADGLIAHELAHQWYGDLLTCRTWAHIWLNEGFASFMDDCWMEQWKGRDWYETGFRETFRRVAEADDPKQPDALVYRDYASDWEPFGHKGAMPYSKGSSVLAMLRHMLGDDVFWKGMQAYTHRFATRNVETEDFRKVLEEVSGRSLERFFEEYCYRPGTPVIKVSYRWDVEKKQVEVGFEQTQHMDVRTPAFAVPIDLWFEVDGKAETSVFELTERRQKFHRSFDHEPTLFCIDPHTGLLAKLDVDLSRDMWKRMLEKGPTAVARLDAARALGEDRGPTVVDSLAACLRREKEFWRVRAKAADGLGRARRDAARDALIAALTRGEGIREPRVRRAAVEALGRYEYDSKAIATIVRFAKADPAYGVEAAATRALGDAHAVSSADVLLANRDRPSRYDRLKLAALDALADIEDARGLDAAMKAGAYGARFRTRPQAIRIVGRLARTLEGAKRKQAREYLVRLLNDEQPPAVRAAVSALRELGDEEAIDPLQRRSAVGRGGGRLPRERLKEEIDRAIGEIRSKRRESSAVRDLRKEVEKLRKDVDELRRKSDVKPEGGRKRSATTAPATKP